MRKRKCEVKTLAVNPLRATAAATKRSVVERIDESSSMSVA
jgi:hypothetical protein